MSLLDLSSTPITRWTGLFVRQAPPKRWAEQYRVYRMLEAYYENNGLYQALQAAAFEEGLWTPGMAPLRNPANRAVEFHVGRIWAGPLDQALAVVADNERIRQPLAQVWQWSNLAAQRSLIVRWFALFGDAFIKVAGDRERGQVFYQLLKPERVIEVTHDRRGYVTAARIDTPIEGSQVETEVWSKTDGLTRYRHERGLGADRSLLGSPVERTPLSAFGIDFVPIVHARFREAGDVRGVGVFAHVLDKIDEANRMATRLHQMLFRYNKPTVAILAGGVDSAGRPLPAPRLEENPAGEVETKDEEVIYFPGASSMAYLVPSLQYAEALAILNAQIDEIERDLPELAYYRLNALGQLSGAAIRLLMSPAIDKANEARANLDAALIQADQMALTIGANMGLFGDIGQYEAGDFAHSFAPRPEFGTTDLETLAVVRAGVDAGIPLATMLRRAGWTQADLEALEADQEAARLANANLANAYLDRARTTFDRGDV